MFSTQHRVWQIAYSVVIVIAVVVVVVVVVVC